MSAKTRVESLLRLADIRIGGRRPFDIRVHKPRLYARVLAGGSLALGESYMDGWWDVPRLDEFFNRLLRAELDRKVKTPGMALTVIKANVVNLQSRKRAHIIGERHYDIGNNLYSRMLDRRMNYSCGYWAKARTLDAAQEAKLDLICRKLKLKKGMKVLDIGCGWGGFAQYAAEKYGVSVVGITVSREQATLARERCKDLPVEIRLQDYRALDEEFDRIVSIGMIEHVGRKNYRTYFRVADRCLKQGGLFLLHTIGRNRSGSSSDQWIERYIFPNSMLPSLKQLTGAVEGRFVVEDIHNFGPDYDKTLLAWHANFTHHWKQIDTKGKYGKRFYRMWTYYLLSSAGSFRSRKNQLWQLVLSKGVDTYEPVR